MAMTLKQAFTLWALVPSNTVLAARSRDAVQRVLMKKWNDIDLEQFTEAFCRQIFYQSTETLELKVKAASILIHLLQWGGDNGHCKRPKFTYDIASEEHQRAEQDKANQTSQEESPDMTEPQQPTNMEQKKTRGRLPRKICQIDPETLQVVDTYDSCIEGCRVAGVKNLDRAIKQLQKAGGYYWQYPDDVQTFAERLKQKQDAKHAPKKPTGRKPSEKKPKPMDVYTSATMPEPNVARAALKVFTDEELMEELDRRGWQGELHRVQAVSIGTE